MFRSADSRAARRPSSLARAMRESCFAGPGRSRSLPRLRPLALPARAGDGLGDSGAMSGLGVMPIVSRHDGDRGYEEGYSKVPCLAVLRAWRYIAGRSRSWAH